MPWWDHYNGIHVRPRKPDRTGRQEPRPGIGLTPRRLSAGSRRSRRPAHRRGAGELPVANGRETDHGGPGNRGTGGPGHLTMALHATASRGGLQVIVGQWVRYVLQIGSFIVLARLLHPSQYGLVGMIIAIVGVAEVIRDFGLSNAALQADHLDQRQISALFWLNTLVGGVCTLLVVAGAPLIGDFYHRPDLVKLAMVLAPVFLIDGMSAQFQANLARSFRFGRIAIADALSMLIGAAVGIGIAIYSPTAWALVVMQLVAAISRIVILIVAQRFLPGRIRGAKVGDLIRFGRNVTVTQLLEYASRNVDTILVGRYWGPFQVGLYNNAYQLLMLPLQQINAPLTRVALPVLSKLRNDIRQYEEYLLSALMTISLITTILYATLAADARDVIIVLLGSRWAPAAGIFRAMCVAGVLQAINYVNYWQFMALNRTHVQLRYSFLSKPIIIVGFVIAAPHGVTDVAWSYTITTALTVPGGFYLACRGTGVSTRRLLTQAIKPLPLGAALFLAMLFAGRESGVHEVVENLLVSLAAGGAALGIVLAMSRAYRRDVIRVGRILALAVRGEKIAESPGL
jgi:PST family polysaccharide transporter